MIQDCNLEKTSRGVWCQHKAFLIIRCAELLVKKKETEQSMRMCMRVYICDTYHKIYSIRVKIICTPFPLSDDTEWGGRKIAYEEMIRNYVRSRTAA